MKKRNEGKTHSPVILDEFKKQIVKLSAYCAIPEEIPAHKPQQCHLIKGLPSYSPSVLERYQLKSFDNALMLFHRTLSEMSYNQQTYTMTLLNDFIQDRHGSRFMENTENFLKKFGHPLHWRVEKPHNT
jgi:hypothetical protein